MGPNELWISSTTAGKERELLLERLQGVRSYTKTSVADRAERIAKTKADPLVEAGWKALLFLTFGAVFILSCLGYVIHAYVSFRNRQLQFAMLRTVGLSMRQLVAMLWVEQVLVIATGMALGTWMGGRLGATIMPFLGHDDWGDEVVPPFVMQVNWAALLTTYAAMILVFAVVSLALLIFIQRISLQRVLRLGEM
jgi:ABC-type antimicrobial peptide transport system permease subunit